MESTINPRMRWGKCITAPYFITISLLVLLLSVSTSSAPAWAEPPRPNVIFILADDLGIGNVGCYGSDHFTTPHVDALAASGIRFTRAFTVPLCGPSRALIMSGRYAFRTGATNQDACRVLPTKELRLARVFKSAGYATSAIGKWGQLPGSPSDVGFDDYLRFKGSGVYWNDNPDKIIQYSINGSDRKLGKDEYMPDVMHEHAERFIRQHQKRPFFLYYSLSHVHGIIQPTPDSIPGSTDLFADNIAYMDKLVGKLMSVLESTNLRDKTLIVFMGDNGTATGPNPRSTIGGRNVSGWKGSMQEGGGLVPLIASWPGTTPTGIVSNHLIDSSDFLPTFASLTGTRLSTEITLDGHSFASELTGIPGESRRWIFNQLARMWYVRNENYKLNQKGELFDMKDAPFSEVLIDRGSESHEDVDARRELENVLTTLNPEGGILDQGDGTGRHANRGKANADKE